MNFLLVKDVFFILSSLRDFCFICFRGKESGRETVCVHTNRSRGKAEREGERDS